VDSFRDDILIIQLCCSVDQGALEGYIRGVNQNGDPVIPLDILDLPAGILCGHDDLAIVILEEDGRKMNGTFYIDGPRLANYASLKNATSSSSVMACI